MDCLALEYIVDVWEIRKHKLYDSGSGPSQQLHSQSSPGDLIWLWLGRRLICRHNNGNNGARGGTGHNTGIIGRILSINGACGCKNGCLE